MLAICFAINSMCCFLSRAPILNEFAACVLVCMIYMWSALWCNKHAIIHYLLSISTRAYFVFCSIYVYFIQNI